jgi:hypothetical protein
VISMMPVNNVTVEAMRQMAAMEDDGEMGKRPHERHDVSPQNPERELS